MPRQNQTNHTKTVSPYGAQSVAEVGLFPPMLPHRPINQNTTNVNDYTPSLGSLASAGGISVCALAVVYGCYKCFKKCCKSAAEPYQLPEGHIRYGTADVSVQSESDHDESFVDRSYRV